MQILINNSPVDIPHALGDITLSQRIAYQQKYGRELDELLIAIKEEPDQEKKAELQADYFYDRIIKTFAFFSGSTTEAVKESEAITEIVAICDTCFADFFVPPATEISTKYWWNGEVWELHPPILKPHSPMTFGEFIDSKQLVKSHQEDKVCAEETLRYICAIFLRRPGEKYSDKFIIEGSDRLELIGSLPLDIALAVGRFYDELNDFIKNSFAVFASTGGSKGKNKNMAKHFDVWGWVNFLKSIAKTKVFDIPGSNMNSIDCVRAASCVDVLVFASEDKSYNAALMADMEANKTK